MAHSNAMTVLGTMSGTSLDGVDAAVIETDGVAVLGFGEAAYRPYSPDEQSVLRTALGCWPGEAPVEAASEVIETAHAELLAQFARPDLIGFHGQTLAHDPAQGRTHQTGDGRLLAEALGCPVAWDFRSTDIEMGGQGAPLAPAYHHALARKIGATAPIGFLNLGGVGNITWVDPRRDMAEEGALLAFDTGPANAPINDLVYRRRGQRFDDGGQIAAKGEVAAAQLAQFSQHSYFSKIPPKSLDRNDFDALQKAVESLSDADAAATLTACAAAAVMRGMEHLPQAPSAVLVTGGGRKNPVLMKMLAEALECPIAPVEDHGLDGDMLEAQAFGFLAARVALGLPTSFPGTTGVPAAIGGGIVSRPAT